MDPLVKVLAETTLGKNRTATKFTKYILQTWREEWKKALFAGIATLGSYGLICVVLQFEALSAIVTLRQVSVLMVVYWGYWKLKEPFGPQRILAGALILIGIFLIGINS